jgi:3-oxoacyl-[acyl-carrier protein] reductase
MAGRVALVTDGAGAIGSATAAWLCALGASVAVTDIDASRAQRVADRLSKTKAGADVIGVPMDVTSSGSIEGAHRVVTERIGHVDVLVNNAGFPVDRPLAQMQDADWHRVLDVCLYGTFACCRAMLPGMADRGYGRVVNVSSRDSLGNPGQASHPRRRWGSSASPARWSRSSPGTGSTSTGLPSGAARPLVRGRCLPTPARQPKEA